MNIEMEWHAPFDFEVDKKGRFIYKISDIEYVPEKPGVYVFSRVHGKKVVPVYIGSASQLRRRLTQHLNNLQLMKLMQAQLAGTRTVHVGEFKQKSGSQYAPRVIKIVEQALISTAIHEGHQLLNKQGTKTLVHTIVNKGNREARAWLPEKVISLRRASSE